MKTAAVIATQGMFEKMYTALIIDSMRFCAAASAFMKIPCSTLKS